MRLILNFQERAGGRRQGGGEGGREKITFIGQGLSRWQGCKVAGESSHVSSPVESLQTQLAVCMLESSSLLTVCPYCHGDLYLVQVVHKPAVMRQ